MPRDVLILVVLLRLDPDHRTDFERYEAEVSRIMQSYGGRIERRVAITQPLVGDASVGLLDEVHLVSFPSEEHFEQYQRDPRLSELAELRARAIRHTEVWCGADMPRFAEPPSTDAGG